MAETDFNELMQAVEQLATDTDETGEIPRVERTPRQVLEASQELWARVTATGAQEIQANLLLGSKGVDLPQLSQKLESLSTKRTLAPVEALPDTDIESYLKNETENEISAMFEFSHDHSVDKWETEDIEEIEERWEIKERKMMNTLFSVDQFDFSDVPIIQERTDPNDRLFENRNCLNPEEMSYAQALMEYNQSVVDDNATTLNLLEKFIQAAQQFNNQMVNEMWIIVKYMTQIPLQHCDSVIEGRSMPIVISKMISQACMYLEKRYCLYMNTVIQNSMRYTQQDIEPSTYQLVRSFVGIRVPRGYLGLDNIELDGRPLWAMVYYCLRAGDIQAALNCVQQAGQGFEDICKALEEVKGSVNRRVSPKQEILIRKHYKSIVHTSTDPYKRVIYCILGGCDIHDEHSEIAKTADDYLWLKLNQLHDEDEQIDGLELLTYSLLQRLIIEEYGEEHFNASQQPFTFFQLLFLTGQWEAAIDFLIRNQQLRIHGVHIAILLNELELLSITLSIKAPFFILDVDDPKPMYRINLKWLINFYFEKFESNHLLEALHYHFCLRFIKSTEKDNVFSISVCELVMRTREFDRVFGSFKPNGERSPGLIELFRATKENLDTLLNYVAGKCEKKGLLEEAVKVHDLAGNHETVLDLMTVMLCPIVSRVDNERTSLRSRLAAFAENISTRYSKNDVNIDQKTQTTFCTLVKLLKFFDCYAHKQFDEADNIIQTTGLVPFNSNEVDEKIRNFEMQPEAICRNIPEVLHATMEILCKQYSKIRSELRNISTALYSKFSEKQLSLLRDRAEAITCFINKVSYKIPDYISCQIELMEVIMY